MKPKFEDKEAFFEAISNEFPELLKEVEELKELSKQNDKEDLKFHLQIAILFTSAVFIWIVLWSFTHELGHLITALLYIPIALFTIYRYIKHRKSLK